MQFYNITELYVKDRLDEILKKEGGCRCINCYMDILSLACNQLPPRYVNTTEGDLYKRLDAYGRQAKTDTDVAIYKALKIVRENPRHDAVKVDNSHENKESE